jgi:hypothetical protein
MDADHFWRRASQLQTNGLADMNMDFLDARVAFYEEPGAFGEEPRLVLPKPWVVDQLEVRHG